MACAAYKKAGDKKSRENFLSHNELIKTITTTNQKINKLPEYKIKLTFRMLTGSVFRTTCTWSKPSISVLRDNIINRISDKTRNYDENIEKRP